MRIIGIIVIFMISLNTLLCNDKESIFEDITFNGVADLLPYFDGRDFSDNTYLETFTSMKFRFGLVKKIGENINVGIKFQDSRILGQEEKLTANSHNIDLAEGYMQFSDVFDLPLTIRAGRFQMEYGTGRFIGMSYWNYVERSFDALKLNWKKEKYSIDLFHSIHSASVGVQKRDAITKNYQYPSAHYDGYLITGLWINTNLSKGHNFDIFAIIENNYKRSDSANKDLQRTTAGMDYTGKLGKFKIIFDLGFQFGKKSSKDISAYVASLKLDYKIDPFTLKAGSDIVSGTDPIDAAANENTFNNYLGAKHKFLGGMDYFSNTNEGTNNLGVNAFYLGMSYGEKKDPLYAYLMAFYFLSNKTGQSSKDVFGQELDLVIRYNIHKGVYLEWGNGIFFQGALMKEIWQVDDDTENVIYRDDNAFMSYLRARIVF